MQRGETKTERERQRQTKSAREKEREREREGGDRSSWTRKVYKFSFVFNNTVVYSLGRGGGGIRCRVNPKCHGFFRGVRGY